MTSASADLSRFQVDILSILADEARSGARVKDELQHQYDSPVDRSRVYQNLGELGAMGYVDKEENGVDGRTHRFSLTSEGVTVIDEYVDLLKARVSQLPTAWN